MYLVDRRFSKKVKSRYLGEMFLFKNTSLNVKVLYKIKKYEFRLFEMLQKGFIL